MAAEAQPGFMRNFNISSARLYLTILVSQLQSTYCKVKSFGEDKMLYINLSKIQFIILKSARRKLLDNFGITLDNIFDLVVAICQTSCSHFRPAPNNGITQ